MKNMWNLKELISATKGTLIFKDSSLRRETHRTFSSISTDSRSLLKGQVFLALKGPSFDGHDFLQEALKKGAKALIVEPGSSSQKFLSQLNSPHQPSSFFLKKKAKKISLPSSDSHSVVCIQVPSTLKALQDLASFYRKTKLKKSQVAAISGSSGKTTTKAFALALLQNHMKSFASSQSFNNHIGLPLSLLATPQDSEALLLEMGMNHQGELSHLCSLAEPHICLVTTVGQAHIGLLGSQEAIACAKEELYLSAPQKAHFIFNFDNTFTRHMYEKWKKKKPKDALTIFSSYNQKATVFLEVVKMDWSSMTLRGHLQGVSGEAQVPIFGRQNAVNLMAASSLALKLGLSPKKIWKNLPLCRSPWGRHQKTEMKSGMSLLFDAYNASPESVMSLLENLQEMDSQKPKRKIFALFGDMMELGDQSELFHYKWGKKARLVNFNGIWFVGSYFKSFQEGFSKSPPSSHTFPKPPSFFSKSYSQHDREKRTAFFKRIKRGDLLVVKGSRAMKLERILKEEYPLESFSGKNMPGQPGQEEEKMRSVDS